MISNGNQELFRADGKVAAVMQPYLFPYIGYFQLVRAVDEFTFYDDVQYIRRGWINRNRILNHGSEQMITLPVVKSPMSTSIRDAHYRNLEDDLHKFGETIRHSYSKAPFFEHVFELVREILSYPEKSVAQFNGNSVAAVAGFLSLDTAFLYSSELGIPQNLERQERLAAIAAERGASSYINAIGGMSLYDGAPFAARDITLRFLEPTLRAYGQPDVSRAIGLSIIDVLMFNSVEEVRAMLNEYELLAPERS